MAYYYGLRGWLEIDPEDFTTVKDEILAVGASYPEDSQERLYMSGWCWSEKGFNWTRYIFYGADVQPQGLKVLEDVLDAVVGLRCEVNGWFHAQGEDRSSNFVYKVIDNTWTGEETDFLIDYVFKDD